MAERSPPSEWVVEHGIGETRALLMDGDTVLATRCLWDDELAAGSHVMARLADKPAGRRRGSAVAADGTLILLDRVPEIVTEGQNIDLVITRAEIEEAGRTKPALGRVLAYTGDTTDRPPTRQPNGLPTDLLPEYCVSQLPKGQTVGTAWEDVWHEAAAGQLAFAGGQIAIVPTPAMTTIDVDGDMRPFDLALTAIPAIAAALRRFDIGGNIGIDFPTLEAKADRRAVDAALADALHGYPHERTAMNGYGFVQIVARLTGPSLLHRFAARRAGMCARLAMRRGEEARGTGAVLALHVHPRLVPHILPAWQDELARRTGKIVRLIEENGLAPEAPHAQLVSP